MLNHLSYLFLFFLLSCRTAVVQSGFDTHKQNAQPGWINTKPVEKGYYIGIGHSSKDGGNDYIQEAKKRALEDIVSEIKVNISSVSVLSQIDVDNSLRDKYEQVIKTTVSDELQGHEQVDAWEHDKDYWVYYRMSKQRYKELKEQQRQDAKTVALDFFIKAKESESKENSIQAMNFYFLGLHALQNYLDQPIRLEYQNKEILLTNEIYASIQRLLNGIQLVVHPGEITLNRRAAQNKKEIILEAFYKDSKKPVPSLALKASFEAGQGDVFPEYKTDAGGKAKIQITKIISKAVHQTISIKVNLLDFMSSYITDIDMLMADRIAVPKVEIQLNIKRPTVHITAIEKVLGKKSSNRQLYNRIKTYLTNSGFELTEDKNKAELWVDIHANSEQGGISGSIYVTHVTASFSVVDSRIKKEIYTSTLERVEGYSLNYERSSQAAYAKTLEKLENDTLPKLLDAILQ